MKFYHFFSALTLAACASGLQAQPGVQFLSGARYDLGERGLALLSASAAEINLEATP
jgi:hypothetical protein